MHNPSAHRQAFESKLKPILEKKAKNTKLYSNDDIDNKIALLKGWDEAAKHSPQDYGTKSLVFVASISTTDNLVKIKEMKDDQGQLLTLEKLRPVVGKEKIFDAIQTVHMEIGHFKVLKTFQACKERYVF
jgi:hypothetical protein